MYDLKIKFSHLLAIYCCENEWFIVILNAEIPSEMDAARCLCSRMYTLYSVYKSDFDHYKLRTCALFEPLQHNGVPVNLRVNQEESGGWGRNIKDFFSL